MDKKLSKDNSSLVIFAMIFAIINDLHFLDQIDNLYENFEYTMQTYRIP